MSAKVTDLIAQLLSGQLKKATITSLNTYEAIRYSLILGLDIKSSMPLVLESKYAKHLLNSGHLTGHGSSDRADSNPLTADDLNNLPKVFKKPDKIIFHGIGRSGYKVIIEKRLKNYHRLIVEFNQNSNEFTVVTYYNTNKKPLA